MTLIAFDSHKKYTLASVESEDGRRQHEVRINHAPGVIQEFLSRYPKGSPVAVETIGNWYWIVDEIEIAGMRPQLVHARKAKLMMGHTNKTDRLDARGLNRLQRTGTLPTVWIPPMDLRDLRELLRTRMDLVVQRTQLKNRIHAALARYCLSLEEANDAFTIEGRKELAQLFEKLPPQTRFANTLLLEEIDEVQKQIDRLEARMEEVLEENPTIQLLRTLPGVGKILSAVIALEIGDIKRFPSAGHLASYAGTTPRVSSSGGKTHFGKLRSDANRFLKWAYIEAANVTARFHKQHPEAHLSRIYAKLRKDKGHAKAIGAVARQLAEATYWMLTRNEAYKEPARTGTGSSTEA
jgi:transposase